MSDESPIEVLDEQESLEVLRAQSLGRLAVSVAGEVDIFPVNFVVHDGALYFRTAPGSKLFELTANPRVAFEVDEWDAERAQSVVVKGVAEAVERQSEIDEAETWGLAPWVPTLKYRWVRVRPSSISGRRFALGPEPERY